MSKQYIKLVIMFWAILLPTVGTICMCIAGILQFMPVVLDYIKHYREEGYPLESLILEATPICVCIGIISLTGFLFCCGLNAIADKIYQLQGHHSKEVN